MRIRDTKPHALDAHYSQSEQMVQDLDRYYRSKSTEELKLIRAAVVHEEQMLGNIPLLASTTPVIFLIFGSQISKYFPHDSLRWVLAACVCILIIFWSINHHFRRKGRVHLELHLVEQILQERSQNSPRPVQ